MSAAGRRMDPRRVALWTFCVFVIVFLLAPIGIIAVTSFNGTPYLEFPPRSWSLVWYRNFFTSHGWLDAAALSLQVGLVTMVCATFLGTLAAVGIVRGGFRGRQATELFLVSPMIVPVIVLAVGLYFLFSGWHVVGKPLALYLGHTLVATPLVLVIVAAALRTTDPAMDLAARSLGASYVRTLWHVTLPSVRPAILSGAAFAFLISFDEVVIAIFVGGPDATTLPKHMWDSVQYEIDPTLTAISSLLAVVAIGILVAVSLIRRSGRRLAAGRLRD